MNKALITLVVSSVFLVGCEQDEVSIDPQPAQLKFGPETVEIQVNGSNYSDQDRPIPCPENHVLTGMAKYGNTGGDSAGLNRITFVCTKLSIE